jgi:hypothetical protein
MAGYQGGYHNIKGRRYTTAYDGLSSMPEAQKAANTIRRDGYNARIITRRAGRHMFFDVLMSVAKSKAGNGRR